jgi:hypothetical protein
VCDFEVIGVLSSLRLTCKNSVLVRVLRTLDLSCEENTVCSLCNLPDVLGLNRHRGDIITGIDITVSVIFPYFVGDSLI